MMTPQKKLLIEYSFVHTSFYFSKNTKPYTLEYEAKILRTERQDPKI